MKKYIQLIVKGIAMGAADVVPGVSGGTIAFIAGIYEELINSLKAISLQSLKMLFKQGLAPFWKFINGNFLLAVFAGVGISIFSLAKAIKFLLEHYPILVWSFFFGLIVASAWFVAKKIKTWNITNMSSIIAGTILAYYITVITPSEPNGALWFVFLSGAIAICAMILPGISGSFILVLLGMYKYVLAAVTDFNITVIAVFGTGAIIGLLSFANVLSWLFKKYHDPTIAVLAGFMIGSLNKVWPWKQVIQWQTNRHQQQVPLIEQNVLPTDFANLAVGQFSGNSNEPFLWGALALMIFGAAIILFFDRFEPQQNKQN